MLQKFLCCLNGAAKDAFDCRLGLAAIACWGSRGFAPQFDGYCCELRHLHCLGALARGIRHADERVGVA
eukprot:3466869-Pleurochrysis_carterae.AAC.1